MQPLHQDVISDRIHKLVERDKPISAADWAEPMNMWEREALMHLIPDDELIVAAETAIEHSAPLDAPTRPASTYTEGVVHRYAPELIARLQRRLVEERQPTQKRRRVMPILFDLFNSKKFVASLLATLTIVGTKLGIPEATIDELLTVVSPLLVYIGAQGFADVGKEKAKIEIAEEEESDA